MKIFSDETSFSTWRRQCGFTIPQAAKLLSKSKVTTLYMDRGYDQRGPFFPTEATRRLMAAIATGLDVTPWPLSPAEQRAQSAKSAASRKGKRAL